MDNLAQELLELLECPVCLEHMKPPIMQCIRGHSVCSVCRGKLTICSICRGRFIETRNVCLENVARKLKYPCKYKPAGCELTFNPDQMAAHQAECEYGRKCPVSLTYDKCEWRGAYKDIMAHIKTVHKYSEDTNVITGKNNFTNPNMRQNGQWYQVVIMQDELFLYYSKTTEDTLYSMIMYVGDENMSKKFKYKMSVTTTNGSKEVTSTLVTPSYCRVIEDIITEEECMVVSYKFVKQCVDANKGLPFEVNIFEV